MSEIQTGRRNEMIELILIWTKGDEISIQRYEKELDAMPYKKLESLYMSKLVIDIW